MYLFQFQIIKEGNLLVTHTTLEGSTGRMKLDNVLWIIFVIYVSCL